MYNVKVNKTMLGKTYFWYLNRCLSNLSERNIIHLTTYENLFFEEEFFDLMYINDYPVFIDLRDDFAIGKDLDKYHKDYLLLKGNFSSQLWDLAESGNHPKGFEYKLQEWELKMRPKIKAFALGRTFGRKFMMNELTQFKTTNSKYKVVSLTGAGIYKLQTENRLRIFNLFNSVFNDKAKLMFFDRQHFVECDRKEMQDYDSQLQKYKYDINTRGFDNYIKFLSMGEYSINVAGLCLSSPFRIADSVIANRCLISTKIYHDIYSTFPCVKLPICGYLGMGDWGEAQRILKELDTNDYKLMLQRAKKWYSLYLSSEGMWENQILYNLEGKI